MEARLFGSKAPLDKTGHKLPQVERLAQLAHTIGCVHMQITWMDMNTIVLRPGVGARVPEYAAASALIRVRIVPAIVWTRGTSRFRL